MKIMIHEEKNSYFTFHGEKEGPITSHENTLYHPQYIQRAIHEKQTKRRLFYLLTHQRRLKEVMAHIYGKIKQIRSSSKFASKNAEKSIAAGVVDDLFPGSLGLPRWRTCQIPDPGAGLSVKIPTLGKTL